MSCYFPKLAFQNTQVKQRIKFTGKDYYSDSFSGVPKMLLRPEWVALKIPCGGCLDCRLRKSREMAIRCVHEAKMNDKLGSIFVTLTYANEHLPPNNTFNFDHPVKFMKRIRRRFGEGIKSYGCAEYGEDGGRPHYHLLLFGFRPTDLKFYKNSGNSRMSLPLFNSESVSRCWGTGKNSNFQQYGHVVIGDVTFQSAAYVARYVMKKNRETMDVQKELGRFHEKSICVSRRPGIGLTFLQKYYQSLYNGDFCITMDKQGNPRKMPIPSYYDRKCVDLNLVDIPTIKLARMERAMQNQKEQTRDRLMVKKYIVEERIKKLVRRYENGSS